MRRHPPLVLAALLVMEASCVGEPSSAAERAPKREPVPVIVETPTPPAKPEPSARPEPPAKPEPLQTSIPAHRLGSLELVCEHIVKVVDKPGDDHSCKPNDGVFDEHERAGLLTAYELLSYHLPVIHSEAGWSVFPAALATWDSGTELNVERTEVSFESWSSKAYGELIAIDIAAVTTDEYDDYIDEEKHWRKVICVPSGASPRCTHAILYRIERAELRGRSRKPGSSYEAKLRIDGEELVVEAKKTEIRRVYDTDEGALLEPGRYSLAQLFAAGERAWEP